MTFSAFRLSEPVRAGPGDVAFVWRRDVLASTAAGLLVVSSGLADLGDRPHIEVDDARTALAAVTTDISCSVPYVSGIHPAAQVHETAQVADGASVGPGAVVAAGAVIGPGSRIGALCTVGERSSIGRDCLLHPGVHVGHDVRIGDRAVLHSGCVLGADGFGFAAGQGGPLKIAHLGRVLVGNDVEIGANSTVDRGTLGDTVIGDHTKIDNLVQIGHNVTIGRGCLIAGQAAIGGSTVLGDGVTLAGNAALSDHITIGTGAVIGGLSGVSKDVPAGEVWFGTPAVPQRAFARRQYLLGRLEQIWEFVREKRRQ